MCFNRLFKKKKQKNYFDYIEEDNLAYRQHDDFLSFNDAVEQLNQAMLKHNDLLPPKEQEAIKQFWNLAKRFESNLEKVNYRIGGYYDDNVKILSKMHQKLNPSLPKTILAAGMIVLGVALIALSVAAAFLLPGVSLPFSIAGIALGLTFLKAAIGVAAVVGVTSLVAGSVVAAKNKPEITHSLIKDKVELVEKVAKRKLG